jgi:Zn-dependent M16 (insulinase) family peptidase
MWFGIDEIHFNILNKSLVFSELIVNVFFLPDPYMRVNKHAKNYSYINSFSQAIGKDRLNDVTSKIKLLQIH